MENKKPFVFISKDRDVLTSKEAEEALREHNDSRYFDAQKGVLAVEKERWSEAQTFESNTWLRDSRSSKDDSNAIRRKHFDNYEYLKDRVFNKAIELGCGPFTNMRYIARAANIKEIHLLDPLILEYLDHPNCTYRGNKLRVGDGPFSRKVPVTTHALPAEDFRGESGFDLVVLINVIEHCYDVQKLFDMILRISIPGALFVFYDKYYGVEEIREDVEHKYDAGHPLRVSGKVLDDFFAKHFTPLLYKKAWMPHKKRGLDMSYYGLYYIGRRK